MIMNVVEGSWRQRNFGIDQAVSPDISFEIKFQLRRRKIT